MVEKVKCEYCDKLLSNTKRSIGSHIGYWHKDIAEKLYDKSVEFKLSCNICNKRVANTNNVLARHVRKEHQVEFVDYIVKFNHDGKWPVCKCGCGEKVRYNKGGFAKYVSGHSSIGKNNGMYGKKGINSPNYGKVRTATHRENYSRAAKKRWKDNYDERCATLRTPEYREKQRIAGIKTSQRQDV